jgi:hypothetical protein
MSALWKDSNYWLSEKHMNGRFWFNSWADFLNQSPFESKIWHQRGIRLLSWANSTSQDIQTIQIVFIVNEPSLDMMYFEIAVKNSDEEAVRSWLANRIPPFWKNLESS